MKKLLIAAFSAAALLLTAAPADATYVGYSGYSGKSAKSSSGSKTKSSKKKQDAKSSKSKSTKTASKSSKSTKSSKSSSSKSSKSAAKGTQKSKSKKTTQSSHKKSQNKGSSKPSTGTNMLLACGTGDSVIASLSGSCFEPKYGTNDKTFFGQTFEGSDYSYLDGEPFGDDTWYRISALDTPGGEEDLYGSLFGNADISVDFDSGNDQRSGTFNIDISDLYNVGDVMVSLKYCNDFQTFLLGDLLGLQSTQGNVLSFNFGDLPHGLSHLTFWGTESGFVGGPPPSAVPIPGALPLFASALIGGAILRKRKKAADNA